MPDQEVEQKANEIRQSLSSEDSNSIIQATVTKVLDQVKDALLSRSFERAMRSSGFSDAVVVAADELAESTGETSEDVLRKASTLYEAAFDAKKKGQRLILAGPDYHFIQEIVGFGPASPEPAGRENVAS